MKNFGERLKTYRKRAGLTQEQVAAEVGLTKSAISQWEHNVSQPDIASLIALRQILSISLDALVAGDPHSSPEETANNPTERLVLQRFRRLTPKKRESWLNLLD